MTTQPRTGLALTENMILQQTRLDSLEYVKSINFWGQSISDISVLSRVPNIEVLKLSINEISSLEPISHCKKLRELYLRKNKISSLSEIDYLSSLPNLQLLWIDDNPVTDEPNFLPYLLTRAPKLTTLNQKQITAEDHAKAQQLMNPRKEATPSSVDVSNGLRTPITVPSNIALGTMPTHEQLRAAHQRARKARARASWADGQRESKEDGSNVSSVQSGGGEEGRSGEEARKQQEIEKEKERERERENLRRQREKEHRERAEREREREREKEKQRESIHTELLSLSPSSASPLSTPSASPRSGSGGHQRPTSHILYAVFALLQTMNAEELDLVAGEAQTLLRQKREAVRGREASRPQMASAEEKKADTPTAPTNKKGSDSKPVAADSKQEGGQAAEMQENAGEKKED